MSGRFLSIRSVVWIVVSAFASHASGQESKPSINYDRLAARIVSALKLRQGERVLMRTDPAYFSEIVRPLQRQIRTAGGTVPELLPAARMLTADMLRTASIFVELPLSTSARQLTPPESAILVRWLDQGGA